VWISLLDVLYTDILRSDHGYKLPLVSHIKTMMDNSSIDLPRLFLAGNVTVKEIYLVQSSSKESHEFILLMTEFHLDNQQDFPSGLLPVDVEDFVIPVKPSSSCRRLFTIRLVKGCQQN